MNREQLLTFVKEYGDSLLRTDAEKELQKSISERAETECKVKASYFKKSAMAYYKDKVATLRDELEEQMDLLDVLRG